MSLFDPIVFAISLVILSLASEIIVDKASRLAHAARVQESIIALLIVSLGTSIPELAVTAFAVLGGAQALAVGTLAGANVADATLVLGLAGLAGYAIFKKRESGFLLSAVFSAAIAAAAILAGSLNTVFGIFAIALYALFLITMSRKSYPLGRHRMQIGTIAVEALTLLAGIALLLVSARFVTDSAIGAVGLLGLHPAIIGIVIALGTTLPEMTVSVTAVRRKHASMALGTALGSLITNLGLILGLASLAAPIAINGTEGLILAWAVASSLASLAIVRRGRISRKQAWLLLILYVLFAATTVALSRVS